MEPRTLPRSYWLLVAAISLLALPYIGLTWWFPAVVALSSVLLVGVARGSAMAWWLMAVFLGLHLLLGLFALPALFTISGWVFVGGWIILSMIGLLALWSPSLRKHREEMKTSSRLSTPGTALP